MTNRIIDSRVKEAFDAYPSAVWTKLMQLRALIFSVAKDTAGVGELQETLKWGQPSYLTEKSKSGSTIRIAREKKTDGDFAMYFKCNTSLVAAFRKLYPDTFRYEGNRAILFNVEDSIPERDLRHCITMALTYHLSQKSKRGS